MRIRNRMFLALMPALVAVAAPAQDCVDYAAGVHVTASLPLEARQLVASGDLLYLSSLHVVDVSVPGQPVDLGAFAGPDGEVRALALDGRFLYAAYATGAFGTFSGVARFDLATPTAPVLHGTAHVPGIPTAMTVANGVACVRTDDGWVRIVDGRQDFNFNYTGALGGGSVTAFDAAGSVIFVYDAPAAMVKVFNASALNAPQLWTSWHEPGVEDIEVAFGQLLVFTGGAYKVYSLANVLAPAFSHVLPVIDRVVDFDGPQAAAWGYPAQVWDMTVPAAPAPLATLPFVVHAGRVDASRAVVGLSGSFAELALGDGSAHGATARFDLDQAPTGLAVLGSHALVIKEMGLDVLDAGACDAPVPVASLAVPGMNDGYAVAGDWLYILVRSGAGSSLQVVDLRDPTQPVAGALLPAAGSRLLGLVAAGDRLYTARGSVLVPIDISDPANPVVGAGLSGLGYGGVAAASGQLLVSANDWELRTFSLADPAGPALVGVLQTDLFGRGLVLDGTVACVLHDSGVALFDVSDPANIVALGALGVPGTLDGFTLAAHRLYVEGNGIHVVDISDPAAPSFVGSLPYGNDTFTPLAAVGQCLWFANYASPDRGRVNIAPLACAAGGGGGGGGGGGENDPLVVAVDIRPGSRTNPVQCRRPHGVLPVAILTTPDFDALTVDHASVRFGPGEAAEAHTYRRHDDRDRGRGRGHGHDQVQVVPRRHEEDVDCDGDMDLLLHFRLEDAAIPCGAVEAGLVGTTFDGREFTGSDVVRTRPGCDGKDRDCDRDKGRDRDDDGDHDDGDHDGRDRCDKGLAAGNGAKAAAAAAPLLAPNPFNPQTRVLFSLAAPGRVSVAVYDLSGRRIAQIADGLFEAGPHDLLWAGRDDAGLAVASGVYFVRVEGAGDPVNLRAVLLR